MILNIEKHEIMFISSRAIHATDFLSLTHKQTDIFRKKSNCAQNIPKCLNSSKTLKSKVFMKRILSFIHVEEGHYTRPVSLSIVLTESYKKLL